LKYEFLVIYLIILINQFTHSIHSLFITMTKFDFQQLKQTTITTAAATTTTSSTNQQQRNNNNNTVHHSISIADDESLNHLLDRAATATATATSHVINQNSFQIKQQIQDPQIVRQISGLRRPFRASFNGSGTILVVPQLDGSITLTNMFHIDSSQNQATRINQVSWKL
jgi:hypothetical protein